MVCKKNTCDLYWFGLKNALRPVGDKRSVLSCTEVLVVGVTSESERGRGSQVSGREWSVCVRAALLEPSQGPGELCDRVIVSCFLPNRACPLGTVPACSFYSLKEIQGYKMSVCGRSLPGKQP
jgi:hypothetical protein